MNELRKLMYCVLFFSKLLHLHDYLLFCFFMQAQGKCHTSHNMELTKFLKEFTIIIIVFLSM